MSKDSSYTHIHFHASHHADLFEEFCHPPSSQSNTQSSSNNLNQTQSTVNAATDPTDPTLAYVPGHFLPFESINLPAHLMPLNPEDEDGVVPDMHAAFSIARAMNQSGVPDQTGERTGRGITAAGEAAWTDYGLDGLMTGMGGLGLESSNGGQANRGVHAGGFKTGGSRSGHTAGVRREGRRGGILSVR